MPNGVEAISTIAANEGRAMRIMDLSKGAIHGHGYGLRKGQKKPPSLKAQYAAMEQGVAKRKAMGETGRMTHGSGGNFAKVKTPKGARRKYDVTVSQHWAHGKAVPKESEVKAAHGRRKKGVEYTAPGPKKGSKKK